MRSTGCGAGTNRGNCRSDAATIPADVLSSHDCQADSPGNLTERSFRCGRAGEGSQARQKGRSTPADPQRLHVSHALSDTPTRTIYDAGSLRDGACCGTFYKILSA